MGVYHVSGLGLSPGALTMPLAAIYVLQAAQKMDIKSAKEFFQYSGEIKMERIGSREETKGKPEVIIAFASNEAITGRTERPINYKSKWFSISESKRESIVKPIKKFIQTLVEYIDSEFETSFGDKEKIKKLYFIEVDYKNFEDCFKKIGITLKALQDKEVWANMIGGSNQINSAILTAGSYVATVSKYYYIFQDDQKLLEPQNLEKPTKRNIKQVAMEILNRWYELPIFNLGLGKLISDIHDRFCGREIININEIYSILNEHGLDKQFVSKLRGQLLIIENDKVKKSQYFEKMIKIWNDIDQTDIKNFSEWKKWAKNEGILHEVKLWTSQPRNSKILR